MTLWSLTVGTSPSIDAVTASIDPIADASILAGAIIGLTQGSSVTMDAVTGSILPIADASILAGIWMAGMLLGICISGS